MENQWDDLLNASKPKLAKAHALESPTLKPALLRTGLPTSTMHIYES